MQVIIEISDYDKEWITNGYYIPEEINTKISEAIVNGISLDKIKAEIEVLPKTYPFTNHIDTYVKEDDVKKIIDKYKIESEKV